MLNGLKKCLSLLSVSGLLLVGPVLAQDNEEMGAIREILNKTQPDMTILAIVPSPIAGMYEVQLPQGQVLYATADGKYFITGDLFESRAEGLINVGEERRSAERAARIAELDEREMVIFAPEGETKAVITVFTDVDCPYCRKLHDEVPKLNDYGISVRYLAFPRAGLENETYYTMISAWCADDPKSALTSAKRGGKIADRKCDNPVEKHYRLGREVGVTGTPALVLEDGTLLPGFVPADTLAEYLLGAR